MMGVYDVGVDSYCSEYMKYVRRGFDTPVAEREERDLGWQRRSGGGSSNSRRNSKTEKSADFSLFFLSFLL